MARARRSTRRTRHHKKRASRTRRQRGSGSGCGVGTPCVWMGQQTCCDAFGNPLPGSLRG